MSRARATALALVNWKGVFYERYLLDRHVTALEGENGAGKTTVMIAAYVVLLPDLSRLRFTNLGETAATGGDRGIWGRLGELGRPSYAVMALTLPNGEDLLAGVHIERKTEPSLELRPFVATGVSLDGSLKDILLRDAGDSHEVPELDEVRQAIEARGGVLQAFSSAKEYFSFLFDKGVLPLRLSTDEERSKMHDMLRTSMTGGISRALTSELRAFLLKEETSLADTVVRMRANLDACRRTRGEVAEAQLLERELTGVFEAARAMFHSVVTATRCDVERARLARDNALREERAARDDLEGLEESATRVRQRTVEIAETLDAARTFVAETERQRARVESAQLLLPRIVQQRELAEAALLQAQNAETARIEAEARRSELTKERDRATSALERAARGLGDRQAGLDELHRRTHAHRRAVAHLEEAREQLSEPRLELAELPARAANLRSEIELLDGRRAEHARSVALRDIYARDRRRAEEASATLEGILADAGMAPHLPADGTPAFDRAKATLRSFHELSLLGGRTEDLRVQAERAEAFADQARTIRARAEALHRQPGARPSSETLERDASQSESRGRELDRRIVELKRDILGLREAMEVSEREAHEFERQGGAFRELAAAAARLGTRTERPVRSTAHVVVVRSELAATRERLATQLTEQSQLHDTLLHEADRLDAVQGAPADLIALRDTLGARLLSSHFEGASVEEGRWLEASLGPLTHALVVPDPALAAEAMAEQPSAPANVWLIAETDVELIRRRTEELPRSAESLDVTVADGPTLRVSRLPAVSVIGRSARQQQSDIAREKAKCATAAGEALREELQRTDQAIADADRLLGHAAQFDAGDPLERAGRAHEAKRSAAARLVELEATLADAARALGEERARYEELRALLPHAHLLDTHDLDARATTARGELERADRAARARFVGQVHAEVLSDVVDALRHAPPSEAPDDAQEGPPLDERRDRAARALEAIVHVLEEPEALTYEVDSTSGSEPGALTADLEAQLSAAKVTATEAEEALRKADQAWEAALVAWQRSDAQRLSTSSERERLERELEQLGGPASAAEDLASLDARLGEARRGIDRGQAELDELRATEAVHVERRTQAEARSRGAAERVSLAEAMVAPTEATWRRLEDEANAHGVALREWGTASSTDADGTEARARGRAEGALLTDRLSKARGGSETAEAVRESLAGGDLDPCGALRAWLAARDWTSRRLPVTPGGQVDPSEALAKLRNDLVSLEGRIGIHEHQLRGTSEDVARSIDVHLRKTAARIRRLNQHLASIGFGSVAGIRIQLRRVERMSLVLTALRGGEMQELLFQSNVPFEEALEEIFRRYGGGSRSGAGRLLDYREYVDVVVEIQRRGHEDWEIASPTRLSTGEAIGVGAALMMVILTEWERDANLLRADRPGGTLRFLFLDEANRLSGDNLGLLFDLCRTLDLQLLVAAPEVARAHGNTTYRLVRRADEAGREEVIVSGRRTIREHEETPAEPR